MVVLSLDDRGRCPGPQWAMRPGAARGRGGGSWVTATYRRRCRVAWLGSRRYPSVAERPAGDAEPGADPGPGVAAGGQALDGLGYGGVDLISVDLISQARHEDECFHVAVSMGDELLTPIGADPISPACTACAAPAECSHGSPNSKPSASPSPKPTPLEPLARPPGRKVQPPRRRTGTTASRYRGQRALKLWPARQPDPVSPGHP
jgi:hypothetical protein